MRRKLAVNFSALKLIKQELKGWQMVLQKPWVSQDFHQNFGGLRVSFLAVMCILQSQFFSRLKSLEVPICVFFQ